jgi:hypothetical protein
MSISVKLARQAGIIVFLGAMIGIVVSLLLNAAYSATPSGVDLPIPPWQPALERIVGPALTFGPAVQLYHFYGRFVLLVIAAFMVGLYGLYANQRTHFAGQLPRLQIWGYRLAMAGLFLNLFGNIGDYWVTVGEILDLIAFVGGTVFGLLLQTIGLALLAISGLRRASMPKAAAWPLILWFPLAVLLLLIGMVNLPSSPLLALSVAWAITGASMARAVVAEKELQEQTV